MRCAIIGAMPIAGKATGPDGSPFGPGFWWGTCASSTQTEGAAPSSDIGRWEAEGRLPASGDGNGFAARHAEDFALVADLGLTHHRLTLDWARLEPLDGFHDPAAVEHYQQVLAAAADAGVDIWVGLHQRTSPGWFADDLGGFTNQRALTYHWPRHVDWLAETFGDQVFGWAGIHHPVGVSTAGWLTGDMPPGKATVASFTEALESMLVADHLAWKLLSSGERPVTTIMNLSPLFPVSPASGAGAADAAEAARVATMSYDQVMWSSWMRALTDGVIDIPGRPVREIPDMAGSFDIIGFSYYSAVGVHPDGSTSAYPDGLATDDYGRSMWPEGLGLTLRRLADQLPGRALMLAECGVASPDDNLRCEVMDANLTQVADAMDDGVDVRGVFHYTAVDAWEWDRGFDVQFGLADRDRNVRPSAAVARRWATGSADSTGAGGGSPSR
jgi:beta-glucosidase